MRVLWFTNTHSLASKVLKERDTGGGWIASLEKEIAKASEIELGVAFHYGLEDEKRFEIGTTRYFSFPYYSSKGKFTRLWTRWMHRIEPDTLINYYLNIVEEFKPDIVHIFGTEQAPYGLIIPQLKVPVIIHIQGNLTVISRKLFSGLSFIDLLRYSNIRNLLLAHGLWHHNFSFLKRAKREQKIYDHCKYFIGRTDWDRRITKLLSAKGVYFHCDEILRSEFYQIKWMKPLNKKVVLFSTIRPTIYKGLETILETAAIINKKQLIDFEWQIAGITDKDEIVRIIEKKYKLKFTEQNISFKGYLNADSLIQSLLYADCFVHPSHIENSPNSVCEAMLLGMPVIATNVGGIPSIIKDKVEGLLVQDGDPYALGGAVIEVIKDEHYATNLGTNARKRAMTRHDPGRIVNEVLKIYASIIPKRHYSLLTN